MDATTEELGDAPLTATRRPVRVTEPDGSVYEVEMGKDGVLKAREVSDGGGTGETTTPDP